MNEWIIMSKWLCAWTTDWISDEAESEQMRYWLSKPSNDGLMNLSIFDSFVVLVREWLHESIDVVSSECVVYGLTAWVNE